LEQKEDTVSARQGPSTNDKDPTRARAHGSSMSPMECFRRDGYIVHRAPVLAPASFRALAARFESLAERRAPGVRLEDMDVPHFEAPALFEWLLSDAVLDLVEPMLGPDIALFSSHFLCKPPGTGRRVPWHEDSWYWKHMLDPARVVTVWLAIDPSHAGNGAMKVIPATHDGQERAYVAVDTADNVFASELHPKHLDERRAVTLELLPNEASLHDARLIHGSDANRSNARRCGYTMRYMSTRTRFRHETCGEWHQIYLCRGRDRAGNVYADPAVAAPGLAARRKGRVRAAH
jgi:hypothetical protein